LATLPRNSGEATTVPSQLGPLCLRVTGARPETLRFTTAAL
jgi:hypothetical protein